MQEKVNWKKRVEKYAKKGVGQYEATGYEYKEVEWM